MNNDNKNPTNKVEQIDLGFGELFAKSGDHIGHFYRSRENCKELLVPFLRKGLLTGDKCVSICTKDSQRDILEALESSGLDVEDALSNGQLVFSEGKTTPEEMRDMLKNAFPKFLKNINFFAGVGI